MRAGEVDVGDVDVAAGWGGEDDLGCPRRRRAGWGLLKLGKQGSTLAGVMDAFWIAVIDKKVAAKTKRDGG